MTATLSADPIIVKVGGSLVRTKRHRAVLHVLSRAQSPIVIVPGGGELADGVREAQARDGFSDTIAHVQALEAMDQMAEAFAALSRRFAMAQSLSGLEDILVQGRIAIWRPAEMMTNVTELPASWDVTSDALAAYLAERLNAELCILVKSCRVAPRLAMDVLVRKGIVDPWFGMIAKQAGFPVRIHAPRDLGALAHDVGALV